MTEKQAIKKGFNAGYRLGTADPKLAQSISNSLKDSSHPYSTGFHAGIQEKQKEKQKEKSLNRPKIWNKSKSLKSKDKGIDI